VTEEQLLAQLQTLFGDGEWPDAVRFLRGVHLVRHGKPVAEAALAIRTTSSKLKSILDADDPVSEALGGTVAPNDASRSKARRAIGQMVVGRAAETVFLDLFRGTFKDEELDIENVTDEGTDTDIYLVNGRRRRLYRINIKFFGSIFRRAQETVGLSPDDCFALATYKIKSGIKKQNDEGKPYFFAIVGVPGLTADAAGDQFPPAILDLATLVLSSGAPGRRRFEDLLVDHAVEEKLAVFADSYAKIHSAPWYILSAERAARLMREMLWERVPALSVKNFTRMFRGAEVDMHFSLRNDLTPLPTFFEHLKEEGRERVATLLSRGDL
jgi:hypothetical protein